VALVSLVALGGVGLRPTAEAIPCDVPTAPYPTVAAALRDANCATVRLAAGTYPENVSLVRDVVLQGAGSGTTSLAGHLAVSGATTDVTLAAMTVDGTAAGVAGCWQDIFSVDGGAEAATGPDLRVLNTSMGGASCRLFADGFESGGLLAWSASAP
jgi:hypothetical protein